MMGSSRDACLSVELIPGVSEKKSTTRRGVSMENRQAVKTATALHGAVAAVAAPVTTAAASVLKAPKRARVQE